MKSRCLIVGVLLGAAMAATGGGGCGSSSTVDRPIVTMMIGQAGGSLSSANGRLDVTVPPGAVASDVAFTIEQVDSPRAGAVGQVFELGPSGMTFLQPVTLGLHFSAADLGTNSPESLQVATLASPGWEPVPSICDLTTSVVSGGVMHLSPWTLILGP
jgi:hypothetical protein